MTSMRPTSNQPPIEPLPCRHPDCAAQRWGAATRCNRCGEALGFGTLFVRPDAGAKHQRC